MPRQHHQRQPDSGEQFSFESILFGENSQQALQEEPELTVVPQEQSLPESDELSGLRSPPPPPSAALDKGTPEGGTSGAGASGSEESGKADLARRQVDEGLKALAAELEAGHSESLIQWLTTMSSFYQYSLNNTLLIAWQRPEATYVAGFHTWKSIGRTVKKGEKGILILAPIPKHRASKKSRSDATKTHDSEQGQGTEEEKQGRTLQGGVWGFRAAHVFDISQTDGKDLPAFATVQGDPAEHLERLKNLIADQGIELTYSDNLQGAFGRSLKGRIEVLEGLTPAHEFSVLAHELAHELLHKDTDRRAQTSKTVRETEAEAVAFVVCRAIGLDSSSQHSDYIKLYQGSVETLSASLEVIRSTANRILAALVSRGSEPEV